MTLTLTDLFCGAGGSSTGAISIPGVTVRVASNHWQQAVDVHNANHQDADHICADLSQIKPSLFPTTDILWASPECTNHSQARGKKRLTNQPDLFGEVLPDEAAERSRATMWDVIRFTEIHHYQAVIVENVVDVRHWLPFESWLSAMDSLGYDHHTVYLNSMHAQAHGLPAPQSRDRVYVVFWRKGNRRPDFERMQRPQALCANCDQLVDAVQSWKNPAKTSGRYRAQYVYRCPKLSCRGQIVEPGWLPAAAAIDWSIVGKKIGDRDKPLADKTRKRIAAGIARYWGPVQLEAAGQTWDAADPKHPSHGDPNAYYRAKPVDEVMGTLHTTMSKALAIPVEGRAGDDTAKPATSPLRTQTSRLETALVMTNTHKNRARLVDEELPTLTTGNTQAVVEPAFMLERRFEYRTRSLDDPMSTLTANDTSKAMVQPPFIAELRGGGSTARPTSHPMATVTAAGNHHGLVTPYYGASQAAKSTDDAIGTLTTVDRYALIMRNNTARGDQGQMSTPAGEVMRTLTTAGHQSLITPGDLAAAEAQVDDCLFRMLEPHEVAAGMAFPSEYIWIGTRRVRVRMAGNAVTPPAARDLVACVAESLTGEATAA